MLTTCPDCGRQVSTRAKMCPHCGRVKPTLSGCDGACLGCLLFFLLVLLIASC